METLSASSQLVTLQRFWFSGAGCSAAVGILVLMALVVHLIAGQIKVISLEQRIGAAEQRVRDAGQPTNLNELDAYYPTVPDNENAALIYQQAFSSFDRIDPEGDTSDHLLRQLRSASTGRPASPELAGEVERFLNQCEAVCSLLDTAAKLEKSRYPIELSETLVRELPHTEQIRRCVKLESIRALHALQTDSQQGFVESQGRLLRMADSLQNEPVLLSQMRRTGIFFQISSCAATGVNYRQLSPETLISLENLYSQRGSSDGMKIGLAGERCRLMISLDRFGERPRNPSRLGQVFEHADPLGQWTRRRLSWGREYLDILEDFENLMNLSQAAWPDRITQIAKLERKSDRYYGSVDTTDHPLHRATEAIPFFACETALVRMILVLIAVERYRLDTGAIPVNLRDLVPKYLPSVMEDPLDGQPLRYISNDRSYLVYSVFLNLVDDDGQRPQSGDGAAAGGDWVFEVRR